MNIKGIEGLSVKDISKGLEMGAKFVLYQYTICIIVMTFKRPSDIYFIKAGESGVSKGLSFSLITILLGWWGFPWGPIYSIGSLVTNLKGGKNVTQDVLSSITQSTPNTNNE